MAAGPTHNMDQSKVQVNLELGHTVQLRERETSEDFTHDWTFFVRGQQTDDIQHFTHKVVFHLHESYPKPKRVFTEPPYKVVESGSNDFLMHIEVFLKNKDKPKKVCFSYNLNLKPGGDHLRCETLTFNNPNKDFKRKLIKAGGVKVVPEGAEASSRSSQDSPILPKKKIKTCHVSQMMDNDGGAVHPNVFPLLEPSKEGSGTSRQTDKGGAK